MFNAPSQSCIASASRSIAAAWVNDACAPDNFYFGYWFSHWRA
ncbi:hypothetical protein SRABI89_04037 [Pseudomonas koreensis]|nr:hypothetical protein SRABI89_04037 [Pseudomonas koreensis]